MQLIPLDQHPSAGRDPSSVLINPASIPGVEIFKHSNGYLATVGGMAFPGLFLTEQAARDAQAAHIAAITRTEKEA